MQPVPPNQFTDSRGLAMSTKSAASATAYAQGVELLLVSSSDAASLLRAAVDADRHFALARVALACALADADMATHASRCDCSPCSCVGAATRRERQHIEVVQLVLSGERDRAAVLGREHLREFPTDVLVSHVLTSHGFA